jgi:hypothetical protein
MWLPVVFLFLLGSDEPVRIPGPDTFSSERECAEELMHGVGIVSDAMLREEIIVVALAAACEEET